MTEETTTEVHDEPVDDIEATSDVPETPPDVESEESSPISDQETPDEPETFSREYVEKLRQENGKYRQLARESDSLATRLHTELVRATGRLADPTDLPFDAEHLEVSDNLSLAIDELLAAKPHLAARRPIGDIGQGATPSTESVSLLGLLKG
jgi:type IV secretory pathway VirB10-like protein